MLHPIVSCAQILHKSRNFRMSEIPKKFVGALGTQARADHKTIFYSGVCTMIEMLEPRALLIYGSVDKRIFELCIARDITLVRYPSQKEVFR